ncbi:prolyl oligopeptidase family serine peptidase [uncultured Proteiniphilum sp.]|uniref:carboxylesterase family protein n=1 Tax=uncultured Proteiniphilum sp. TaxID=497637 RepID=UPI002636FBCB|nr:prolyl oligopeptidase family serine peptidase [uncultured Proteiniphilum sp.]
MTYRRTLTLFLLLSLLAPAAYAQYQEYDSLTYISEQGDSLLYRQLNPLKIEKGKKYPLVLFLHGAGERGSDNISQLHHGALMFTNPVNREEYPAFVLFPQCPADLYWPTPKRPDGFQQENPFPFDAEISKPLALTKELLDKIIETYPVDTDRIYIVGLSMGGMGTFDMVCRFPDLFAAAIPVCGGIHTDRLHDFSSKTAFRIFHGDADPVVPVRFSREAYLKLKAEGADVEYIEFPGVNHGSWDPAFNRPDFMSWLFEQRKK